MFNTSLTRLPVSAKILILGFLIVTGWAYIFSILNVNYTVGMSLDKVKARYAGVQSGAAEEDEFADEFAEDGFGGDFMEEGAGAYVPDFKALVSEMHFHLAAHAMMFFITGLILMLAEMKEGLKAFLAGLPFAAVIVDSGSILLTRFAAPFFAVFVILGGILMAMSFATVALIAFYQMFLKKTTP